MPKCQSISEKSNSHLYSVDGEYAGTTYFYYSTGVNGFMHQIFFVSLRKKMYPRDTLIFKRPYAGRANKPKGKTSGTYSHVRETTWKHLAKNEAF